MYLQPYLQDNLQEHNILYYGQKLFNYILGRIFLINQLVRNNLLGM